MQPHALRLLSTFAWAWPVFRKRLGISWGACALQISLIAGLMFLAAGALQLGFLTHFLSHSVISGFATGSAIIIATSQACAKTRLL